MAEQRKRWILRSILLLVLFFIPIISRCYIESFVALSRARSALGQSEYRQATQFYVKAIRWRAPLNIFATQAVEELRELIKSESKADQIYALSELRRALFSSRSFYFPSGLQSPDVQEIDTQLKELGERRDNPVVEVVPQRVSYSGQFLVQLGFWGWVGCMLILIWRGFQADGKVNSSVAMLYGSGALLFFILWVVALRIA